MIVGDFCLRDTPHSEVALGSAKTEKPNQNWPNPQNRKHEKCKLRLAQDKQTLKTTRHKGELEFKFFVQSYVYFLLDKYAWYLPVRIDSPTILSLLFQ